MKQTGYISILALALLLYVGCGGEEEEATLPEPTPVDTMPDTIMVADTMPEPPPEPEEPEIEGMRTEPVMGFTVQTAACTDLDYAQYLLDLYRQRGYDPYITTETVDGTEYYRIRIGDFESYADAKALSREIHDKYSVDAWIAEP